MQKYENGELKTCSPEEEATAIQMGEIGKEKKVAELADKEAKENLKASAKAKLIAGEPLTEAEANTIVL